MTHDTSAAASARRISPIGISFVLELELATRSRIVQ